MKYGKLLKKCFREIAEIISQAICGIESTQDNSTCEHAWVRIMLPEASKLRFWALLISILIFGSLFHILDSNVFLARISYAPATPSRFKGEIRKHERQYEAIAGNKQSHQLQKEENVMSELLGRQNGRESDPSLKAWQEEQMQRRALVDKACAENRKGKEKGKKDQFII